MNSLVLEGDISIKINGVNLPIHFYNNTVEVTVNNFWTAKQLINLTSQLNIHPFKLLKLKKYVRLKIKSENFLIHIISKVLNLFN